MSNLLPDAVAFLPAARPAVAASTAISPVAAEQRADTFRAALAEQGRALAQLDRSAANPVAPASAAVAPVDQGAQTPGDMILSGLELMRTSFNRQMSRVGATLSSGPMDTGTMLAAQVEMMNFSMMVDITSKLIGKSTQSFDQLMKGQ
ncbi:type III secretion system inner rod subunit SctI [Alsobacter sp. SYSU M60028]|uniref:Type III secretion system inner rod subunit SctI n=1 Tax=Alsobacter ponti TaxID=2962936 RepID=A0ABT1LEK9_9HYPH|nr:type III secretion system inner rod subunit SctI [Alsobacter ponti]MCP8939538.1 type III secretion system inner rod subunit SctI [Alsobacter ponti]